MFLKVLLNWPDSLFTWDILFLVPVPWVGPVIAPCIISLSMIVLTFFVVYFQEKGKYVHITFMEWILFIFGSITAVLSFMWDYIIYVSSYGADKGVWTLSSNKNLFDEVKNYVPHHFNWWLFWIGQVIICLVIWMIYKRTRRS